MGKARRGGQKRKEAPARRQLQGRGGSSGLLHKNNHKQQNVGTNRAAGLDGGAAMGKRTLAQQLLQPSRKALRGKRRRKLDGSRSQPGSSETAAIQAEYAAVDARAKARAEAERAQRTRLPVKVRLAPATTSLRMLSEGGVSTASLRASSSARMVEALLHSITDDPAPAKTAPPSRPVRSAGRKRKGNPFAALGGDGEDSDSDSDSDASGDGGGDGEGGGSGAGCSNGRRTKPTNFGQGLNCGAFGGSSVGSGGRKAAGPLVFASPTSFAGFSGGRGGGGDGGSVAGGPWSKGTGATATVGAAAGATTGGGAQGAAAPSFDEEDDDPDL